MLLLKAAPQDLPYSKVRLGQIIVLYFITGVIIWDGSFEPAMAISRMSLNIVIFSVFSYSILSALELKPRMVQTLTALVAIDMAFNVLTWPLLIQLRLVNENQPVDVLLPMLALSIISWQILVTAHIFKHALSVKMLNSIIVSFGLFLITMTLSQLLFPEQV